MLGQGFSDGDSRMKMKRKDFDLEDFSCEVSDFPLTSPARKIRRLDAELAPIIEEPGPNIPVYFQHFQPEFDLGSSTKAGLVIEELPSALEENEERAMVLFNPANASIARAPTNYTFSVNPEFISSFKNDVLWSRQSNERAMLGGEEPEEEQNKCLAVVPWAPSQPSSSEAVNTKMEVSDMTEAEEMEVETMEVEDSPAGVNPATGMNMNMNMNDGLHQWQMQQQQQQHCLIPQPPQNISTPIVWYR